MAIVAENERKRLIEEFNKSLAEKQPGDTDAESDAKFAEVRKTPAMREIWKSAEDGQ